MTATRNFSSDTPSFVAMFELDSAGTLFGYGNTAEEARKYCAATLYDLRKEYGIRAKSVNVWQRTDRVVKRKHYTLNTYKLAQHEEFQS